MTAALLDTGFIPLCQDCALTARAIVSGTGWDINLPYLGRDGLCPLCGGHTATTSNPTQYGWLADQYVQGNGVAIEGCEFSVGDRRLDPGPWAVSDMWGGGKR
ncbi:MAG: hypothetical protein EBR82_07335 [Caulobacteraceae bacterium]|nr:hypothetical protein [Caulobacteraceae bacterium]